MHRSVNPFTGRYDLTWALKKTQYRIVHHGTRDSQLSFGRWPSPDVRGARSDRGIAVDGWRVRNMEW